jgi:pentatricopeptide repeat protein
MQKNYLKLHDLVIYDIIIIIAMCRSRKLKDALELFFGNQSKGCNLMLGFGL